MRVFWSIFCTAAVTVTVCSMVPPCAVCDCDVDTVGGGGVGTGLFAEHAASAIPDVNSAIPDQVFVLLIPSSPLPECSWLLRSRPSVADTGPPVASGRVGYDSGATRRSCPATCSISAFTCGSPVAS